jgi:Flp pilus assembly protein TadG
LRDKSLRSDAGSFAVEFALVAPFAVAVLALVLVAGSVAAANVHAQSEANLTALQLARGMPQARLSERARSEGYLVESVERAGGVVCAHLKKTTGQSTLSEVQGVFTLIPLAVSARACAALDPA